MLYDCSIGFTVGLGFGLGWVLVGLYLPCLMIVSVFSGLDTFAFWVGYSFELL